MSGSMLDQLLEEAAQAEESHADLDKQVAEAKEKMFSASKVYAKFADDLTELVKPMVDMLPTAAEYEEFARAHDGKVAGSLWNAALKMDPAKKQLQIENPGLVFITMGRRTDAVSGDYFPELTDAEYEKLLDDSELLSFWWEKNPSVNSVELAKSVIVHTVLENRLLRELVFGEAKRTVRTLVEANAKLAGWKEDR